MTVLGEHIEHWKDNARDPENPETVLMGGVKLACACCQWAFEAVNETIGARQGYRVQASGTHGQFFPGWQVPDWLKEDPEAYAAFEKRVNAAKEGGIRTALEGGAVQGDISEAIASHDPETSASEYGSDSEAEATPAPVGGQTAPTPKAGPGEGGGVVRTIPADPPGVLPVAHDEADVEIPLSVAGRLWPVAARDADSGTPRTRRDTTPRYAVRSAFDARRFRYEGETVTDVELRIALRTQDGRHDLDAIWASVQAGVQTYYNYPRHTLDNGDRFHVTVTRVDRDHNPHMTVDITDRGRPMDQYTWWLDADPEEYAHELAHQFGLRDEYADLSAPQRPDHAESLLGRLGGNGLRGRHLSLLTALIGELPLETHTTDGSEHSGPAAEGPGDTTAGDRGDTVAPMMPPPGRARTVSADLTRHAAGWGGLPTYSTDAIHRIPRQGTTGARLSDVLPEREWWRVFLDPADHANAQAVNPHDPGSYYDNQRSPGFRAGMVNAYRFALEDPHLVLNADTYSNLHRLITSHLYTRPVRTGDPSRPTQFPLGADRMSDDTAALRVDGRRLLITWSEYHADDFGASSETRNALAVLGIPRHWGNASSIITIAYKLREWSDLIDSVFSEYRSDIRNAPTPDERLAAIARTITKLHILHPFTDANGRLNIYLVLPKLLLDNGFKPVIPTGSYNLFNGGAPLSEQVALLRAAQLPATYYRPRLPEPTTGSAGTQARNSGDRGAGTTQHPVDTEFEQARLAAPAIRREHFWSDPVSDPRRTAQPGTTRAHPVAPYAHPASHSGTEPTAGAAGNPATDRGESRQRSVPKDVAGTGQPTTQALSRIPAAPRLPDESSPLVDTVVDPAAGGSPEAIADRAVIRQVPPDNGRPGLDVLRVASDGDCFFTSVLASAARQHPASAVYRMTVRQLRDHAGDWFAASGLETSATARTDPLDDLVRDLGTDTLRYVLGGVPRPGLTQDQQALFHTLLTERMYGDELRRRTTDPEQRSAVADLTREAIRDRLPDYTPNPTTLPQAERDRLADLYVHRDALLTRLVGELRRDDTQARRLWGRLLETAYPRWASTAPALSEILRTTTGELIERAIRDVRLWVTPFFDRALSAVARSIGLDVVVVQDGLPDQHLVEGADRQVYIHYNGIDHYSALAPTGAAEPGDPFARIEAQLDTHRPPRLDRSLLPPSRTGEPVVFSDGSRLPAYLTGDDSGGTEDVSYGHSHVTLRGTEDVVREIGDRMDLVRPADPGRGDPLADLERALRTTPRVFRGDGYESPPFLDRHGRVRVLKVTTRPLGNWERFTDVHGSPVKVDEAQRSQVTTGADKTVSTTFQGAPSVAIGPPAGAAAYGRAGGVLALNRSYRFGMQEQTLSQVETRMADGSHLHLDDVQYEVSLSGAPSSVSSGLPRPLSPGETYLTFAVRNGLTVRLSDSETSPDKPGRAPRTMTLGPQSDYRLVHTEGYGSLKDIRDWALARAGAEPGTAAYDGIVRFFTSGSFHRMADRLAHGNVTSPPLFGEDDSRSPLGAFVVERVVPGKARLLSETAAAELRNTIQQTVKNERTLSKTYTQEINASLGPSFDLLGFFGPAANLRAMFGAFGRYGRSTTHSGAFGGSGSRKIVGRAKKVPTDLYLVSKTVYVRKTGDEEATPFTTWSLDRMTRTEARRHAGWDDGTTLRRRHRNEPFAPAYLTKDNPAVLGMSRPEAFTYDNGDPVHPKGAGTGPPLTLLASFTDQVIRAAARKYPGMLAPLEELGDPSDKRWRNAERYRMALQNTLTVINTLSQHSVAGNLEALTTTGIRIGLVDPDRFTRARRWIWIDGKLSDRRYEGTQNDLILRGSAPGTERLDGAQNVVRAVEGGFDARVLVRDAGKDNIGWASNVGAVQAGPRWSRQKGRRTGYGATVSYEPMAVSAGPSHLHSYRLELTAQSGGHWRPRSLWRGIPSLGLLGTRFFVRREAEVDLLEKPLTGRVVLSVPDEHTPDADPHTAPAETAPRIEALDPAQAKALATGDTREVTAGHGTDPFGDQPYQTVSVGAHAELVTAVEAVMKDASGGSWHFAEIGASAHDAAVRPFQPQYLTAGFDQTTEPAGSRITGLFGEGFYLNRLGTLVHRTRVVDPVVVSKPVQIETEQTVGSDLRTSGASTTTTTFTLAGTGALAHTHLVGPSLVGSYGLLGRLGRSRTTTRTVTRTVASEIDRDAGGHKVLVAGGTQHDIAGSVRADGVLAPLHSLATWYRTTWAGRRLTFASDWLGHLPEKAAHRLGLIRDRLGEVPRYTARVWSQPKWLRDNPFGSYPVNTLDTTMVLADFDRQLLALGIDDASRDRVHSLVTPRAVRALRDQMSSGGTATRTRVGGWGRNNLRIGGRTGSLRVELIADEPQFDGLDHSATLQDNRVATETVEEGLVTTRTGTTGVNVGEGVRTGDSTATAAGPTYGELGTTSRSVSTSRSTARLKTHLFYPNEPYAEYLTRYRLRLTLELGGRTVAQQEGDVGRLREQLPLSLTVPRTDSHPDDPLGTPELDPPARVATVWQQGSVTPQSVDAWRSVPHPDGTHRPFRLPANGFHVRRTVGLDMLRAAGDLAVAKAYGTAVVPATGGQRDLEGRQLDTALAKARRTGLTLPGTASALALHDGTDNAALAAFFGDSTTAGGHAVAGLTEDTFVGGAQGDYRLYSKPDFAGARLLAVAPDATMESAERHTDNQDVSVSRTGVQVSSLGVQPVLVSGAARAAVPGAPGTGVNTETDGRKMAAAEGTQLNIKPKSGRSFLFAIPTSWLGVADVERHFKDSAVGSWLGRHLGPFGYVRPGPQAVEAQTQVIAWVREDIARELGLVDDDTFPSQVADAWAKVIEASGAWVAADRKYWEHRRAMPELRESLSARRLDLTAAKYQLGQALKADRSRPSDPEHGADPDAGRPESALTGRARRQVRDATAELRAARRALRLTFDTLRAELRTAEVAAAEFHRVRAETDRLTRWHRLPAGPHGPGEPEQRAGLPEPLAVVFGAPAEPAPERERYTETPGQGDAPTTLTSPTGEIYTVREVPADGDAFYHALAEGLQHADPALLGNLATLPGRPEIVTGLRERLTDRLRRQDDADLRAFTSPDTQDAFNAAEMEGAGVAFDSGSTERREFDDSGHLPLHAELPDAQRVALASAQLHRPGDTADGAGWDHGAADLLPALAARTFGVRITVVRADGGFQHFAPPKAAEGEKLRQVVLHLKDRHYRLAVPQSEPARQPELPGPPPLARPAEQADHGPRRPAHGQAPWTTAGTGAWRHGTEAGQSTLTAPDGTVHDLVEPSGDGNGFWPALAAALHPDRERDPAGLVSGRPLPPSAVLDPGAPFTHDELVRAGVTLDAAQAEQFQRNGGRLPDDLLLTQRQTRELIRTQVYAARRWDEATTRTAAQLAASVYRVRLTVVAEDGSVETHVPYGAQDGGTVTLYLRNAEYLLARPRTSETPADAPIHGGWAPEEASSSPLTESGGETTGDFTEAESSPLTEESPLSPISSVRAESPADTTGEETAGPEPTVTVSSNAFGRRSGGWSGLWSPALRPIPEEDLANVGVPEDITEELSVLAESTPASPSRTTAHSAPPVAASSAAPSVTPAPAPEPAQPETTRPARPPRPAIPRAFLDAPRPRKRSRG
ncbi:hypothetical protein [Streptomyces sp. NBC_00996]|uniref:hypothetical protein n=1 Tax=Streptomyces sp. NBC_00996 TaxID=2903710 RepID=UPI00386709B7|nr:nucleic acid/nucleotide deaminase domain-containing protein [Streptomyces sp. NBC_00996]